MEQDIIELMELDPHPTQRKPNKNPGSGRGKKKGSTNLEIKKKIREYTSESEARAMIEKLKKWAKKDKKVGMWYAEQMFGKARQNTGLDGGKDGSAISMSVILDQLEGKK